MFRLCALARPVAAWSCIARRNAVTLTPTQSQMAKQLVGQRCTIQGYDDYGFEINNVNYRGSVIVLPNITLLWDARTVADITLESLSPAHLIKPRISILLIGTGERLLNIDPAIYGYFRQRGISVEPMASNHAIAGFGVLVDEGRDVGCALLCDTPLTRDECCLIAPGGKAKWGVPTNQLYSDEGYYKPGLISNKPTQQQSWRQLPGFSPRLPASTKPNDGNSGDEQK